MPNSLLQKAKTRNRLLFFCLLIIAVTIYAIKELDSNKHLIYLPIDANDLNEIIIHQTPIITLQKINDSWFVMQNEPLPANKKVMQNIFDMLSTPLRDKYPISDVSLKELSLEPPNLMVQLDGETLNFGSLSPIDQMHYVQFKDHVYLASPFLKVRFSQSSKTFLKPNEYTKEHKDAPLHGEH